MSDEIQQNRYDQLIRRVGGIIGPGSKVAQVITELFPMIDVENVPSELLILGGTAIAFRSTDILAGVGDENASQLLNPTGSGKLLTITQLVIVVDADVTIKMTLAGGELANSNGFGEFRDSRAAGSVPAAAVGNTRIETGLVVNPGLSFRVLANAPFSLRDDNDIAVLLPGDHLTVGVTSLNKSLLVGYLWRERAAEASELKL